MLAVLGSARISDIAWKFIRLVGLLALGMGSLAAGLVYRAIRTGELASSSWWVVGAGVILVAGAAVLAAVAPLLTRNPVGIRRVALIAGASGVAGSVLSAWIALDPLAGVTTGFLVIAGQLASCWLLGSITVAWLLGHAYLTATRMTIAPLRYFSNMLTASVLTRIALVLATVGVARLLQSPDAVSLWTQLGRWWLIVLLRVGVGLVAVGIFAYMVRDCVRLRSTQSATGILYFASVMAYVGELAGQYLTRELGWPM